MFHASMHQEVFDHERRVLRTSAFGTLKLFLPALGVALTLAFVPAMRAENLKTESRMMHLHRIPLRDADAQIITVPNPLDDQGKPQEAFGNPYSPATTCGRCHEYE